MVRREGQRSGFKTIARLMLLPILGLALILGWSFFQNSLHTPASGRHVVATHASVLAPAPATAPESKPAPPAIPAKKKQQRHGDIVVILDDVGFDHQPLASAMAIDPNVNFAILPNSENAQESARTLHGRGFELLCHLPMQPLGYPKQQPGANAILTSMTDEQIADTTRANVGAIPNIRGVNNHMGSAATSDRRVMTTVLGALPKGLYFIDSKTAGTSIAGQLAHEMDIRTASRNVFLDDVQSESAVRRQLGQLADAAATRGQAVGIGHMYPVTMKVLGEEAPRLRAEGFRFIRASEAVR
jgi:polysaccharide deacetylase 2 family uncharacterized protein YibQ